MTPEGYLGSIYLNSKLDQGQGLLEHTSPEVWYVNLSISISLYKEREAGNRRRGERRKADIQFALSYFLLFDAATLSSHAKPPSDAPHDVVPVHMSFVDWVPAICSTRTYSPVPLSLLHCSSYQSPHILSLYSVDSVVLRLTLRLNETQSLFSPRSKSLQDTLFRSSPFGRLRSKTLTTSRIPSSFPPR